MHVYHGCALVYYTSVMTHHAPVVIWQTVPVKRSMTTAGNLGRGLHVLFSGVNVTRTQTGPVWLRGLACPLMWCEQDMRASPEIWEGLACSVLWRERDIPSQNRTCKTGPGSSFACPVSYRKQDMQIWLRGHTRGVITHDIGSCVKTPLVWPLIQICMSCFL